MKNFDELKFRQVHLDFHTSGHIENIGVEFDEEQFIKCLKLGHLNSITVFALCHHGYCYYETEAGTKHPHLQIDLLPAMLKACEKAGVDAPVYITVGWNELIGKERPEWIVRDKDGTLMNMQNLDKNANPDDPRPWGWNRICMNTPYLDYLLGITREVMEKFNPVEIFYDITGENECYCESCLNSMKAKGIDADNPAEVKKFGTEVYINSMKEFTDLIWGMNPKTKVYHNAGDRKGRYDLYEYFSHYEIESLPTGAWGYGHFPHNAKYFSMTDMDFLGMTGKFHTAWGEFGGYKNPDALKYECARIIALGGKCSIGDQMPPCGLMDEETYRIIGEAYKHVEEREQWCSNLTSIADVGVLCPSSVTKNHKYDTSDMGAALALTEMQILYDMIDETMPFDKYKVMILPDHVLVNEDLKKKLESYLNNGGKLLLSGESGLDFERKKFQLDLGLEYAGPSEWDVDYTLATDKALSENQVKSPYLNYGAGLKTKVCGAEALATTIAPYFNRTYKHFCSHRNTPPSGKDAGYPSVARKDNIVYMAHNIFNMYQEMGAKVHRDMIQNCLSILLPEKTLDIPLPSCGTTALYKRKKENDFIFHALYANPIKRGEVQVIEDIVPLYKIPVKIKTGEKIKTVKLLPSGDEIPFKEEDGEISFEIAKLDMHAMFQLTPE